MEISKNCYGLTHKIVSEIVTKTENSNESIALAMTVFEAIIALSLAPTATQEDAEEILNGINRLIKLRILELRDNLQKGSS